MSNESGVERGGKVKLKKKIVIIIGVTLIIAIIGVSTLSIMQLYTLNILTSNNKALSAEILAMALPNAVVTNDEGNTWL